MGACGIGAKLVNGTLVRRACCSCAYAHMHACRSALESRQMMQMPGHSAVQHTHLVPRKHISGRCERRSRILNLPCSNADAG